MWLIQEIGEKIKSLWKEKEEIERKKGFLKKGDGESSRIDECGCENDKRVTGASNMIRRVGG